MLLVLLILLRALGASGGDRARPEDTEVTNSVSGSVTADGQTCRFSLPVAPAADTIGTTKGVGKVPGRGTLFTRRIITPS